MPVRAQLRRRLLESFLRGLAAAALLSITACANGDFGEKTQAALGQFQLARNLPASGQLDDATLAELGVQRDSAQSTDASTGASSEPAPQPQPQQKPEG